MSEGEIAKEGWPEAANKGSGPCFSETPVFKGQPYHLPNTSNTYPLGVERRLKAAENQQRHRLGGICPLPRDRIRQSGTPAQPTCVSDGAHQVRCLLRAPAGAWY